MYTTLNEWKQAILESTAKNIVSLYNELISFVNSKIDHVLAREGELPDAYFQPGLEDRLDALVGKIATAEDLEANRQEIVEIFNALKDGWAGLQASGKY